MSDNPQCPNKETEPWNKQTPTQHLKILLESCWALFVLLVKTHVNSQEQHKEANERELGEKNKGYKNRWRKAKVSKRERRRTPGYHGEEPKKDSARCEVSEELQEGEEK